jgi:hypothetical protein
MMVLGIRSLLRDGGIEEPEQPVCEWKREDNRSAYHPSCNDSIKHYVIPARFIFCPYCGKEIKEVENERQ